MSAPRIREDDPAASSTAATRGRPAGAGAPPARGCGRSGISFKSPPTPIAAMSAPVTSSPAASRSSTQSAPFNAGERAQPGRPTTARPPCSPRNSRLPGSTGIPKRISRPPAAATAAGQTSAASDVAEPPRISTIPAGAARIAAATAPDSWATVTGGPMSSPSARNRAPTAAAPLASKPSFMPGVRVRIRLAWPERSAWTRSAPPPPSAAAARATAAPATP